MVRNIVFRETLVGNVCVSTTRWNRVATVSGRCCGERLAALTSPQPPPLPRCGRGGGDERSRGDSTLASVTDTKSTTQITPLPQCGRGAGGEGRPHAMIVRARYMPNEKFLIRLSDVLKGVHQCSNDRSVLNNDVARTS